VDNGGQVVDYIEFGVNYPWPIAANALGATSSWLPVSNPYASITKKLKYKGQALSRRSFTWPTNVAWNWFVENLSSGFSNLDKTTSPLLPRLESLTFSPTIDQIHNNSITSITVTLSPWPITGITISFSNGQQFILPDPKDPFTYLQIFVSPVNNHREGMRKSKVKRQEFLL